MRLYFHHYTRVVHTNIAAHDLYACAQTYSPVAMCIPSCYLTCYLVNLCVLCCCTLCTMQNNIIFSFATARYIYTLYVAAATVNIDAHIHFTPPARPLPPSYDTVPLQTDKRNNRPAHHVNVWSSTYCITHLILLSPKDISTMLFNVK